MVVDASAILAVLFNETDGKAFLEIFAGNNRKVINPFNALEAEIVISARKGPQGKSDMDQLLFHGRIEIIPFDRAMAELAFETWQRYGKGRHKAGLNMGDCCAYATSKFLNEPLLFKGNDFVHTDIHCVL